MATLSADNSTTTLDLDNDPQPDVSLRIVDSYGGREKLGPTGSIVGAPEMIVEIAASSFSYDMGAKMNAYRRDGVDEYLVYRAYDGEIDWFILRDGEYKRLAADGEGVYRSEVFPGLWLKADAFIAGDLALVLAVLQRGIASADHGEFTKKLESQRIAGQK
ncbi:MAG TPA: Uma2 family endonuclease [Tepidisphaeraceae bacterium]|jgi:hypothetical protein|nr:Uma2 family endonuclease [Tepidisphaeraceae bacterium]